LQLQSVRHIYFPEDWVILREAERIQPPPDGKWRKRWHALSRTRPYRGDAGTTHNDVQDNH
jgi:hypothetical protein